MTDLILASTSPYRRALLERLGLPFRVVDPRVDEDGIKATSLSPQALAERLALAKSVALGDVEPDAWILGGDQLVSLDGQVLNKPGTVERAVEQLTRLAGREHQLITAIAVSRGGRLFARHTDLTTLRMRPLTIEEIRRYVQKDQPADCAGAYKLESLGITLFERITTEDQTAITGLPLIALTTILRKIGFRIP